MCVGRHTNTKGHHAHLNLIAKIEEKQKGKHSKEVASFVLHEMTKKGKKQNGVCGGNVATHKNETLHTIQSFFTNNVKLKEKKI